MDVEAFEEGYLAKIITPEGGVQAVGSPVAMLVANRDDISKASAPSGGAASVAAAAPVAAAAVTIPEVSTPRAGDAAPIVSTGRIVASGWAKAVAAEKGIDLRTVTASRADGLITEKDLVGAATGTIATVSTWVPGPGVINATPRARQFALENGLDVKNIKGTGNFGRVTGDDVLIAAGKKVRRSFFTLSFFFDSHSSNFIVHYEDCTCTKSRCSRPCLCQICGNAYRGHRGEGRSRGHEWYAEGSREEHGEDFECPNLPCVS